MNFRHDRAVGLDSANSLETKAMNTKTHPITRRTAIRGLGAMLALPYLDIMGNRTLAAATCKAEPARLACLDRKSTRLNSSHT